MVVYLKCTPLTNLVVPFFGGNCEYEKVHIFMYHHMGSKGEGRC